MKKIVVFIILACVLSINITIYGDELLENISNALGAAIQTVISKTFDIALAIRIRLAIDYENPYTRSFILSLIHRTHEGNYNIAQVCDLWDYCRKNWVYINDPYAPNVLFDTFSSASETIAAGLRGDCDDFAILLAAGVRAIGGTAIVKAESVKEPNRLVGHAYTLVYIGSDNETVALNLLYIMVRYHLRIDDFGKKLFVVGYPNWGFWLSLDWFADHPGGPWWGENNQLVDSHYLPTPSKWGLLTEPVLIAPYASLDLITHEFSPEEIRAIGDRK
jgi:hypothetical protein